MVIVAMIGTLIIRVFDPLSWSPSMVSIGNATHVDVRDVRPDNTNVNAEYHLSNYTNANDSHEFSADTIEMLGIDYGSLENETSTEGEKAELETSSVVEDLNVKPADGPERTESGFKRSPSATKRSLRDRVDYLLGWKGPTSQSRDEVS